LILIFLAALAALAVQFLPLTFTNSNNFPLPQPLQVLGAFDPKGVIGDW
jgi:hypothetical protein